ncbi:hypothetical protein MMC10_004049 [Thelotrema lepadinum]|nr:hypothetical protein [Thelotrema lepadinum]
MSSPSTEPMRAPHARSVSAGTIKAFNSSTGLGWIRPEDGGDDLPLKLGLDGTQIKSIFPGQKIEYEVEEETDQEGHVKRLQEVASIKLVMEVVPRWLKLGL